MTNRRPENDAMPQTPPPAVSPQSPLGTAVGAKVRAAVEAEHSGGAPCCDNTGLYEPDSRPSGTSPRRDLATSDKGGYVAFRTFSSTLL